MKTTFKKISLLTFIITLSSSCTDKDDAKVVLEQPKCQTEDVGITQLNKYASITYQTINGNQVIDEVNSSKWEWKIYNDTIEITGWSSDGNDYTEIHNFFKKNESCISYLSTRWVFLSDTASPPDWYTFNDVVYPAFGLQAYTENQLLVAKAGGIYTNDGFKIWMEFTPENHHPAPYDYEQYYHP